jgi:hypothetical protein
MSDRIRKTVAPATARRDKADGAPPLARWTWTDGAK